MWYIYVDPLHVTNKQFDTNPSVTYVKSDFHVCLGVFNNQIIKPNNLIISSIYTNIITNN